MKRKCPICNAFSNLFFKSKDYNRKINKNFFYHYKCINCGLIFIKPQPKNLCIYYPNSYHFIPDSIEALKTGFTHESYKIELIKRFKKNGKLLEIGPSLGCFAYLANCSGFQVEAIEMDERCSNFLNEVVGIPTKNTNDPYNALTSMSSFDVITLWHVIEHLTNPWKMLEKIVESLDLNGILVIAAPNPNAFQFKLMGRYWPHVDAPRHLMLIPSDLIIKKLETLGMKLELNTTNDKGGLGWNVFGWEIFFSNLSQQRFINRILHVIGRFISILFNRFEKVEGKGAAYTLIFRKIN